MSELKDNLFRAEIRLRGQRDDGGRRVLDLYDV